MKFTVLNDLHIGVQRSGGTTPDSAIALRHYTLATYAVLLCKGDNVIINGDMFDTYNIPLSDLLRAYQITADWLSGADCRSIDMIPGNHDLSKNSLNLSSFEMLARLLMARFPGQVTYLPGGNWIDESAGLYAISHVPNQDLFELALGNVPDNVKTLLLHCNFDNEFAGQSDHSLNLARDQAKVLTKRGITIVLGHEHQGRTMMGDKVIIVGNQFPTSVSDCLVHGDGQKDGRKYCLQIDGEDMELLPTWSFNDPVGGFLDLPWDQIDTRAELPSFVRVCGKADAEQSAEVVKAISKLRQNSKAFVITNGVRVGSADGVEELAESAEDIRSVNVVEMLLESLDPEQQAVVRKLLAEAA